MYRTIRLLEVKHGAKNMCKAIDLFLSKDVSSSFKVLTFTTFTNPRVLSSMLRQVESEARSKRSRGDSSKNKRIADYSNAKVRR